MLYEVLKTAKMGAGKAPDLYTALLAKNLRRDGEVKTLSGAPPLSFQANGQPLLDYLISGNTVQSGTPNPDNPIMPQGTGERTGNLFDDFDIIGQVPSVSNGNLVNSVAGGTTSFIKIDSDEIVLSYSVNTNIYLFLYDNDYQYIGYAQKTDGSPIYSTSISDYTNAVYCRVRVDKLADFSGAKIMLNTGSTALPYEPHGIKIPISSAGQTTPIYLGEVETRKIKKLVLTGEEAWGKDANLDNLDDYFYTNAIYDMLWAATPISSHFIQGGRDVINSVWVGGSVSTPRIVLEISKSFTGIISTDDKAVRIDKFKSYLAAQYAAGTPVTVWYVLATPETAVVNEPLMKIGDYADTVSMEQAGVEIPTARGTNTLDALTDVKPSEVYIKYKS